MIQEHGETTLKYGKVFGLNRRQRTIFSIALSFAVLLAIVLFGFTIGEEKLITN